MPQTRSKYTTASGRATKRVDYATLNKYGKSSPNTKSPSTQKKEESNAPISERSRKRRRTVKDDTSTPQKNKADNKQKTKVRKQAKSQSPKKSSKKATSRKRKTKKSAKKEDNNDDQNDENNDEKNDEKENDNDNDNDNNNENDNNEENNEKRLARYRAKCPAQTKDRIHRAQTQRLFMISAKEIDETTREYAVLGSTGNVYTVNMSNIATCSCPDSQRGNNPCKHILFVLLKVLRIAPNSKYLYQKALLTSELKEIFSKAPRIMIGVMANASVRKKYSEMTGENTDDTAEETTQVQRKPIEGDCAVCMEEFESDTKEEIVWCKAQCGQNVHKQCFEMWCSNLSSKFEDISCVYCRTAWVGDEKITKSKQSFGSSSTYVNLGQEQGLTTVSNTYTQKHWKRSWWGY